MRPFSRKSQSERLLETVNDSLDALSGGLTKSTILKGGLIAGGLAGLTAASAAISSLRRRHEGTSGDS
jgi:TRAP-type mannitol/chloroaromatic compound transport system permease large subunit